MVDILASPVREQNHRSGKSKPAISVRKANAELADKHHAPNAFQAMQTDWAEHAQKAMDKDLLRGRPKAETAREHVAPEVYAASIEEQMEDAEFAARQFAEALAHHITTRHADLTKNPLAAAPGLFTYQSLYTGFKWNIDGNDDLDNAAVYFVNPDTRQHQSYTIDNLAYQTPEACLEAFKSREAEYFGKSRAEIAEKDRSVYEMIRDVALHEACSHSPLSAKAIHAVGYAIRSAMHAVAKFYENTKDAALRQARSEVREAVMEHLRL